MKGLFLLHLVAAVLSAVALWSMRYEFTEKPASRLQWAVPPALALIVAAILLYVSPGKRFELWTAAIILGLVMGLGAGVILKVDKDFERKLVRVQRAWDGIGAATLLFLLALTRLITSDFTGRHSGKYGLLGAIAVFLAVFLFGRVITMRYYTAPRSIHLDMTQGEKPRTD
jgi:membrane protein CcdC involved in cytochrome C biogenesis